MTSPLARTFAAAAAIIAAQCAVGYQAFAAEEPKTPQQEEIDRLKDDTARAKAEEDYYKQRTARDKAMVAALQLPTFENKTTLGTGGGAIEATMLGMYALQAAATIISDAVCDLSSKERSGGCAHPNTQKYLVLGSADPIDFSPATMIDAQMKTLRLQFTQEGIEPPNSSGGQTFMLGVPAVMALISGLAGAVGQDTSVTGIDLAPVSERALINAVAARLKPNAYLPGAAIGAVDPDTGLLNDLNELILCRQLAVIARAAETQSPNKDDAKTARLTALIDRFDAFLLKITTVDSNGVVPIVRAARLHELLQGAKILRIYMDKAGGTFINTKNIATYFGADPVRVSGAVLASYSVTEPGTGEMVASDIFVCRTTLTSLRSVQRASWQAAGGSTKAICLPAGSPSPSNP